MNGRNIQLCLISRRSRFRAGTRYFRRGIDHEGHVANFNETEQIVLISSQGVAEDVSQTLSFVQIRGSVPVFWAEVSTLRFKPDLQIMDVPGSAEAARRHLQEQVQLYGDTSLVNLVDQKGRERFVKEAYERIFAEARHFYYLKMPALTINRMKRLRFRKSSTIILTSTMSASAAAGIASVSSSRTWPKIWTVMGKFFLPFVWPFLSSCRL
jgi:hypothetical protein